MTVRRLRNGRWLRSTPHDYAITFRIRAGQSGAMLFRPAPRDWHETEYDFGRREGKVEVPKSKFSEAQIVAALRQVEAGRAAADVAREVGVTVHTIYGWKAKYGGMDVSEAQEARQLREENARLRKLVADLSLDKDALKSVIAKNGWGSER